MRRRLRLGLVAAFLAGLLLSAGWGPLLRDDALAANAVGNDPAATGAQDAGSGSASTVPMVLRERVLDSWEFGGVPGFLGADWTANIPAGVIEARLEVTVDAGAFAGLRLSGPPTCQGLVLVETGSPTSFGLAPMTGGTPCGAIPPGDHEVTLALDRGYVHGRVDLIATMALPDPPRVAASTPTTEVVVHEGLIRMVGAGDNRQPRQVELPPGTLEARILFDVQVSNSQDDARFALFGSCHDWAPLADTLTTAGPFEQSCGPMAAGTYDLLFFPGVGYIEAQLQVIAVVVEEAPP